MNDTELTWNETERNEILKTPVFTVTERTSAGPDGRKGKYIVNEAPDWVIVIPVSGENFLMVKQWRHGEKALSIEFPGGVIDKDESPKEGAVRELKEETGASAKKLTLLGKMNPNPALFANHVYVYCAEDLVFSGIQDLDADECLNYMQIPQSEVIEKIGTAEYPHALMASALALFMRTDRRR
ncbi:NUDIX hydrolase [uncultured Treponema sp.]|uniref:NUDIX hydrolase n=1 Tax=uncultured Treponema sp. TaxID=162155 RepID=UPI0025840A21|nr:NUDIX hydrolase [uncultured Treponema sp.]